MVELPTTRNRVSEAQFETMLRHLHAVRGTFTIMGVETLSGQIDDLERSMQRSKQESAISEVSTQSASLTSLAICLSVIVSGPQYL